MTTYYDDDVMSYIDNSILLSPLFDEWFKIVEPILKNDEFQKRKLFPHHHNMSVWEHSILVSFKSYKVSKRFKVNSINCAIAGLLHDFYPWSWMYNEALEELDNGKYLIEVWTKHPLFKRHGFTHAKAAAENYIKYFPEYENKRITNSIKRHMFPLNIVPPRYKEGYIVTMVDKFNSFKELPSASDLKNKLLHKLRKTL